MFSCLLVEDLGADLAEDLALEDRLLDLPLNFCVSVVSSRLSDSVLSSDSLAIGVFSLTSSFNTMVSPSVKSISRGGSSVISSAGLMFAGALYLTVL